MYTKSPKRGNLHQNEFQTKLIHPPLFDDSTFFSLIIFLKIPTMKRILYLPWNPFCQPKHEKRKKNRSRRNEIEKCPSPNFFLRRSSSSYVIPGPCDGATDGRTVAAAARIFLARSLLKRAMRNDATVIKTNPHPSSTSFSPCWPLHSAPRRVATRRVPASSRRWSSSGRYAPTVFNWKNFQANFFTEPHAGSGTDDAFHEGHDRCKARARLSIKKQ